MARSLSVLREQYNSVSHGVSLRGGGMGRGPGPRAKGKPKELGKTVKRLLSYVGEYKLRLISVFVCMILTTVSSLLGGYLIVPIINRITLAINPSADLKPSRVAAFADGVIEKVVGSDASISTYVFTALVILAAIYFISSFGSYLQARIMLSVSQNSIQRIRNDLFEKLQ